MGDSCSNSGMQSVTQYIATSLNTYAECIEIGGGGVASITMKFSLQAEEACASLKSNPKFQGNISVMGLSQGALIARYIIESCDFGGEARRYVSIGGPQMGVGVLPQCTGLLAYLCMPFNYIARQFVYLDVVQNNIGPAGYFRDPYDYKSYVAGATFLPDLNNEKNRTLTFIKEKYEGLEKLVLVMFEDDTMIIPKETAWFGFYDVDGETLVKMEDSDFYKQDYIGMKKLNEAGKANFVSFPGNHLQFNNSQIDNFIIPALI
jgi:palmitoyl-protein thioesterase